MIKVYLLSTATDGQYQFGDEQRSYANTFLVGSHYGHDVVMVATSEAELDYLSACTGYIGDIDALKAQHPDLYKEIEPVIFAGEAINDETEGK